MSLPPKENDLVGILNNYEKKIDDLEFIVSTQNFDTGSGISGPQGPQGLTGPAGPQGSAATVTIGTVTTGAAGSSAAVANSGTSGAAVFDFTIPKGDKGDTGSQGPQGLTGATGSAATISIGAVTTGTAGSSATVVNAGTSSSAVLNFTIPRGDVGATGAQGPAGINGGGPSPIGAIIKYGAAVAPSGWLLCDGSAVSRTTYANLFAVIGTNYGSGNGSTTFNLPTVTDSIIAYENSEASGGTSSATGARVMFFA